MEWWFNLLSNNLHLGFHCGINVTLIIVILIVCVRRYLKKSGLSKYEHLALLFTTHGTVALLVVPITLMSLDGEHWTSGNLTCHITLFLILSYSMISNWSICVLGCYCFTNTSRWAIGKTLPSKMRLKSSNIIILCRIPVVVFSAALLYMTVDSTERVLNTRDFGSCTFTPIPSIWPKLTLAVAFVIPVAIKFVVLFVDVSCQRPEGENGILQTVDFFSRTREFSKDEYCYDIKVPLDGVQVGSEEPSTKIPTNMNKMGSVSEVLAVLSLVSWLPAFILLESHCNDPWRNLHQTLFDCFFSTLVLNVFINSTLSFSLLFKTRK